MRKEQCVLKSRPAASLERMPTIFQDVKKSIRCKSPDTDDYCADLSHNIKIIRPAYIIQSLQYMLYNGDSNIMTEI